tara:strand:- start:430 stop:993 length:564 start_codon:yes stop_codon:yes gene_type:complete
MKFENLKRELESFAKNVEKQAKGIMANSKDALGKARGNTAIGNSIRFEINEEEKGVSVKFFMLDYGTYLDKGVSGNNVTRSFTNYKLVSETSPYRYTTKQPPPDILSRWIKKKGIKPKGLGRGRDIKTGQYISNLAFIIGKKIKARGIPSISFLQKPLGENYAILKEKLLTEFKEDVRVYLTTFTKN